MKAFFQSIIVVAFFGGTLLFAETNSENALPKLAPPYGELAPTFWEQHGISVVLAVVVGIALVALGLWLIFRPKPKIILPPEAQARRSLEILRQQPENGEILSRVSQAVRNYFITAFQLPPGEFTSAEFSRALSSRKQINAGLSAATVDLLRICDERKFSTTGISTPLNAASQALNLIERAEVQREELRQIVKTQTRSRSA